MATRHNVGFDVVERVAHSLNASSFEARCRALVGATEAAGELLLLVKPQTFMNGSGEALTRLLAECDPEPPLASILVVVDDVNLPLGRLRFRGGGSCGGHNGLASVEAALATDRYPRLRLGLGAGAESGGVDFVLGEFSEAERRMMAQALDTADQAVRDWINQGLEYCQNQYNGWEPHSEE